MWVHSTTEGPPGERFAGPVGRGSSLEYRSSWNSRRRRWGRSLDPGAPDGAAERFLQPPAPPAIRRAKAGGRSADPAGVVSPCVRQHEHNIFGLWRCARWLLRRMRAATDAVPVEGASNRRDAEHQAPQTVPASASPRVRRKRVFRRGGRLTAGAMRARAAAASRLPRSA